MNTELMMQSVNNIGCAMINSDASYFAQRKKNQRIELSNHRNVYYLQSGSVSVFLAKSSLLVLTVNAPAIIGLAQLMLTDDNYHFWRCSTDCDLCVIENNEAKFLFSKMNLWKDAFIILSQHVNLYFNNEKINSGKTVKEITVNALHEIWLMDPLTRKDVSVYNFIIQRNNVSRSAVHKAIQELILNNTIVVKRGKLIEMNTGDL